MFASLAAAEAPAAGLAVTSVRPYSDDAVSTALTDPAVDAVLVAYAPVSPDAPPLVLDVGDADKPVVAVYPWSGAGGRVPVYPSVEEAVRALGKVAAYAAWRREPAGVFTEVTVDRTAASAVIGSEDGWTGSTPGVDTRAGDLLRAYGVEVVAGQRVSGDPDDVAAVAEVLGLPVALKVAATPWRHRFDLGAVRLNLATVDEVVRAHTELQDRFGIGVEVVVQRMAPPGVPCVVKVVDDPAFGPVVGFGLGGLATDLLGDLAWCPAPLSDRDAARLLRGPLAAPLLHGYRGTPSVDVAALSDLLLRIGQLADDQLRLAFLELNPVLAHERGLSVLHAEAQVGPPASRPDTGPRRL